MIDRATVQSRRASLQQQIERARLAYADLEIARDQAIAQLAELGRHLDGMAGGLQELDALLSQEAPQNGLEARLNEHSGRLV